jgi:hypothetical protein
MLLLCSFLLVNAAWATTGEVPPTPSTIFPPAGCTKVDQRVITWRDGSASTVCLTGQGVMHLALPNCQPEQYVVYDGSNFFCETVADPPNCGTDEFLTHGPGGYICKKTGLPPVCAGDEVLSYTPNGFICVKKSRDLPTCGPNQFLTYNGADFQCATVSTPTIPNCPAGQVVTGDGNSLRCVDSNPRRACSINDISNPNLHEWEQSRYSQSGLAPDGTTHIATLTCNTDPNGLCIAPIYQCRDGNWILMGNVAATP